MKVSLVLTIFLLLIVAWFVIQSVLIVFEAFFKAGGAHSGNLHLGEHGSGKLSSLGPDSLEDETRDKKAPNKKLETKR
jgi:hypothetical protein